MKLWFQTSSISSLSILPSAFLSTLHCKLIIHFSAFNAYSFICLYTSILYIHKKNKIAKNYMSKNILSLESKLWSQIWFQQSFNWALLNESLWIFLLLEIASKSLSANFSDLSSLFIPTSKFKTSSESSHLHASYFCLQPFYGHRCLFTMMQAIFVCFF